MRYMLLMHAPRSSGDWNIFQWKPHALQAHLRFIQMLNEALMAAGELVSVEALTPPHQARTVRAETDGKPMVSDGPYPESKEFLAGYWIVDVEGPERAYAIAARASSAPGPDGVPLRMPIEVRIVMSSPREPSASTLT